MAIKERITAQQKQQVAENFEFVKSDQTPETWDVYSKDRDIYWGYVNLDLGHPYFYPADGFYPRAATTGDSKEEAVYQYLLALEEIE